VVGVGVGAGVVGGGVVGGGVVGVGVTVVGVAVGVSPQVQVAEGLGDVGGGGGGVVYNDDDDVGVGLVDVDASADCETNSTVKLVAASAMLASPAILARFFSFNVVTRFLLAAGKSVRGQEGLRPVAPLVIALQCAGVLGWWDTRAQCYRRTDMLRVGPLCSYAIVTIRRTALTLDRWA
jgi:hypothetical protein